MRFDETTARYGEFGSFFVGHIINTNEFDQFFCDFLIHWYVYKLIQKFKLIGLSLEFSFIFSIFVYIRRDLVNS